MFYSLFPIVSNKSGYLPFFDQKLASIPLPSVLILFVNAPPKKDDTTTEQTAKDSKDGEESPSIKGRAMSAYILCNFGFLLLPHC